MFLGITNAFIVFPHFRNTFLSIDMDDKMSEMDLQLIRQISIENIPL
jgi:hypothetical protein